MHKIRCSTNQITYIRKKGKYLAFKSLITPYWRNTCVHFLHKRVIFKLSKELKKQTNWWTCKFAFPCCWKRKIWVPDGLPCEREYFKEACLLGNLICFANSPLIWTVYKSDSRINKWIKEFCLAKHQKHEVNIKTSNTAERDMDPSRVQLSVCINHTHIHQSAKPVKTSCGCVKADGENMENTCIWKFVLLWLGYHLKMTSAHLYACPDFEWHASFGQRGQSLL